MALLCNIQFINNGASGKNAITGGLPNTHNAMSGV